MEKYLPYAVLFLRLALVITLLAFVADKFGIINEVGTRTVNWGDMDNYSDSLQIILPFISENITKKLAVVFIIWEVILALMLLFGLKVRWAAIGISIYSLVLAVLMLAYSSVALSLNYSLLAMCAAAFLLACCPIYRFTLNGIKKRSTHHLY